MPMRDPRIAQLRAKADSTTYPAEAAALRAKADELEASQPASATPEDARLEAQAAASARWVTERSATRATTNVRFEWTGSPGANFFEQMGGVRVQVHVAGRTYWITVE